MPTDRAILPSMLRIWALNLSLLSIVTPRYFDDLQQVIVLFSYLKFISIQAAFILGGIIMAKDFFGFTCSLFAAHQLNKFCNFCVTIKLLAIYLTQNFTPCTWRMKTFVLAVAHLTKKHCYVCPQKCSKCCDVIIAFLRSSSVLLPYCCRFQNLLFLFFVFKIIKEPLQIV